MTIDRDQASRYGIQPQLIDDTLYDAFGQRQVAQYFTQVNSYRVVLEVTPKLQGDLDTLNRLYMRAPATGQLVPLSTFVHWTNAPVRPLSISHQGQFAATTISFNLAQGTSLGEATAAIDAGDARSADAVLADGHVPGNGAGVPAIALDGADADPRGPRRRLSHPRRALRELHPSDHDPVDAAFGGPRRARDADAVRLRFQPRRADRHHPAHRHREEERHHARRFRDRRGARPGSVAVGIDPSGGHPALPADPDDDDGGAARRRAADARHRHRIGDPPAARLCDVRRPDRQSGADACSRRR